MFFNYGPTTPQALGGVAGGGGGGTLANAPAPVQGGEGGGPGGPYWGAGEGAWTMPNYPFPTNHRLPSAGTVNLGGGGGGSAAAPPSAPVDIYFGGNGGSGTAIIRYVIAEATGTAKATGGAITFYGGKTIHTFTASGTFGAPPTFNETCEYVVVAGGGGANCNDVGGAGGAGGYLPGSTPITGPGSTTIQIGAGGKTSWQTAVKG